MNSKTEKPKFFWRKNRKTNLKNSQNRKTENPNAPPRDPVVFFAIQILKIKVKR